MIHETSGDILLSKAHAIAHGIAPNDDFRSGLALALREHAPALYKDFRHYWQQQHPKAGDIWAWMGADGQFVVNLYTQEAAPSAGGRPGKATLQNVRHSLKALRQFVEAEGIRSLALPRLATGVGGLDWDDVRPLVREYLGDLDIPVNVYTTYRQGEAALEKL